jgi:hypothetical protein
VNECGTLYLSFLPEGEIRQSVNVKPKYEINNNELWVRILMQEYLPTSHYEVSSGLIVGLGGGVIADIYLLGVEFR